LPVFRYKLADIGHWPATRNEQWCGEFLGAIDPGDETPISQLELGTRARNSLVCNDRWTGRINTIGGLVSHTADELLERRNFGETTLTQVRSRLAARGLKLKGD